MKMPIDSQTAMTSQEKARAQLKPGGRRTLRLVFCLLLAGPICTLAQSTYTPYAFTTLAGKAKATGSADGTGSAARFFFPAGVAVDSAGNVYVGDTKLNRIRKITSEGVVTTLAGGTLGGLDGTGSAAQFNTPFSVAVDSAGNVFVADKGNNTIRRVSSTGVVTTLAGFAGTSGSTDGEGIAARFRSPSGVAVDAAGIVYVADTSNSTIRQVTRDGEVTTLAGLAGSDGSADGTGTDARFNGPTGVAVDNFGNVYVADRGNNTIRKITSGMVSTIAGSAGNIGSADGTGGAVRFNGPTDVAVDSVGNVYVTDIMNQLIRRVAPSGVVTTLAGRGAGIIGSEDGTGRAAGFDAPTGIAVDNTGNLYVADYYNSMIRKGSLPITLLPYFLANGELRVLVSGPVNSEVELFAGDNLHNWSSLATNRLTGGTWTFSDPQATNFTSRFYRANLK